MLVTSKSKCVAACVFVSFLSVSILIALCHGRESGDVPQIREYLMSQFDFRLPDQAINVKGHSEDGFTTWYFLVFDQISGANIPLLGKRYVLDAEMMVPADNYIARMLGGYEDAPNWWKVDFHRLNMVASSKAFVSQKDGWLSRTTLVGVARAGPDRCRVYALFIEEPFGEWPKKLPESWPPKLKD